MDAIDPARWERVKTLVAEALERAPADRLAWLDAQYAGDGALRAEVESLLGAAAAAGTFLERPAAASVSTALDAEPPVPRLGQRIGPWRITGELGHGGMGEVYEAERDDGQFEQRAALKLVRRGLDAAPVLERFLAERRILATLDHPNIARLLDGGLTPDGQPWFAMERVQGEAIDDYCRARGVPLRERIALFVKVCNAVHFAHQRLVVHRDLKPANILVDASGEPKLLDFGIARLLEPGETGTSPPTRTALRAFTPEYASPEQVRGDPVTTASDVYALGVLLHELLTGRSPYRHRDAAPHELAREICEVEPARPSSLVDAVRAAGGWTPPEPAGRLRPLLRGDLDVIVLTALRKAPERRYASAQALADDLRRHLAGLPVSARPDTWAYRTGKFVRRHALAVGATAAVAVSLVAGLVMAEREARIARAERERAEQHFDEVRKLANTMLFDVHDAIRNLPGSTAARELLVKNALEYLNALAAETGRDAELARELSAAYERVSDVQGGFRGGSLGDTAGGLESARRSLALREGLLAASPDDPVLLRDTARVHTKIGDLLMRLGQVDEAVQHSRRTLGLAERLTVLRPQDPETRRLSINAHGDLGSNLAEAGRWAEALPHLHQAEEVAQALAAAEPGDPVQARVLALVRDRLATALTEGAGQHAEAAAAYRRALAAIEAPVERDPSSLELRSVTARIRLGLGQALERLGDHRGARAQLTWAVGLLEAIAATDQGNVNVRQRLALALGASGELRLAAGERETARSELGRALELLESLPESRRSDPRTRIGEALVRLRLADALYGAGQSGASARAMACELLRSAFATLEDPTVVPLLKPFEASALAGARGSGACRASSRTGEVASTS